MEMSRNLEEVEQVKDQLDEENRTIKEELEEHKSRSEELAKEIEELKKSSSAKEQSDQMLEGLKQNLLSQLEEKQAEIELLKVDHESARSQLIEEHQKEQEVIREEL